MIDRNYILNRLKSKAMSRQQFDYEIMSAPPIYSMFSQTDIDELHYYASSAKYSARLKEKYEAIDRIMSNRGFEKLVAGTNRVSYIPLFADNFIVKIAYDTVALKDSLREYHNQFLIKPFCTKVFEVTPCGTLGVFERVNPVTSRKEYISMAADIYRLLSEYVIGDYIIDDIGTQYYQNIGFRNGFGPVILDFPYVYKVDPKKIWCNKPDPTDHTGYCNGAIDYDLGFNKLVCKKCGAIYKPYELAAKYKFEPEYIKSFEEDIKMKFSFHREKDFRMEEKITGEFQNPIKAIKSEKLNREIEKELAEEEAKTVNGNAPAKEEESEAEEKPKKVKSPIVFDESIKGKKEDPGYANEEEETFDSLMTKLYNMYRGEKDSDKQKEMLSGIITFFDDVLAENIEDSIKLLVKIFKKKSLTDATIKDFLDNNSCSVNNQFVKLLMGSDNYYVGIDGKGLDLEDDNVVIKFAPSIYKVNSDPKKDDKIIVSLPEAAFPVASGVILDTLGIAEGDIEDAPEIDYFDSEGAEEFDVMPAEIISRKDLIASDKKSGKVIVIKNNNGYLTINGKIVAINKIDDMKVEDTMIVPIDFYNQAQEIMDSFKESPTGSLPEEEDTDDEETEASGEES